MVRVARVTGPAAPFGVRRPLRFLAFKLGLDERQVAELAQILNELKTERAQAAVDHRRTVAGFADALAGDTFDQAKADTAAELRLDSARKLRDAVVRALGAHPRAAQSRAALALGVPDPDRDTDLVR